MMASSPICLLSKDTKTKSWLWHRRLSHLNFGPLNHLARNGLVRGHPRLKFEKEHLCSVCAMGKIKKQSHKPKSEDTNQEKLYLPHMDLCGPMRVASVNEKKYILVIVNDYSRFTWVKFLALKDEALDFIIKFIKMIQVRLNAAVRNSRTDNGTEFVNQTLQDYYEQFFSPLTSVAFLVPVEEAPALIESTSSLSLTTIDQDAPLPRKSVCHNSIKNDLRKLKGKDTVDITAHMSTATTMASGMYNLDPIILAHQVKNNRETHEYYLKHTIEQAAILREDEDTQGKVIDPTHYHGMVGTLMYLTSSRPDLVYGVYMYAQYQARPTEKHLHVVKRIFRYLRGIINQGLRYSKDSTIALTAFTDADHVGFQDTRHSTSGSTRLKTKAKVVKFDKKKQPAKMPKAKELGDGIDFESRVPDEHHLKTTSTDEGISTIAGVPDVPRYDFKSNKESEGDNYELTDDEKIHDEENIYEEKEDEITKELYKDVNMNLGNEDTEMTYADQGGLSQQNVSQESGFEQEKEDASDNEIASLMETSARHATSLPEITSSFTINIPTPPSFFNPLPQQATPTPTPTTSKATTSFPSLPNFSSVFRFNNKVTNLEKDLSEIKQVNQYAQALSSILAIVDHQEFDTGNNDEQPTDKEDQEFKMGNNDEQPADKEVSKEDWFKKPGRPPTPDFDWNKRQHVDFRPPQTWISQVARAKETRTSFNELMGTSFDISAFGPKRQHFYGFAANMSSSKNVYSKKRIIIGTRLSIMKKYDYGHLEEIEVRREDQKVYKFREGDFPRLRLQNIEDMLLVLVQQKLTNLTIDERDGTLNDVWSTLHDIAKGIGMEYLPKRKWSVMLGPSDRHDHTFLYHDSKHQSCGSCVAAALAILIPERRKVEKAQSGNLLQPSSTKTKCAQIEFRANKRSNYKSQ
nr:retrovirus-related Pol polyprotein from transposon TNT 1-94 [Tanacetum cinerariifolium]